MSPYTCFFTIQLLATVLLARPACSQPIQGMNSPQSMSPPCSITTKPLWWYGFPLSHAPEKINLIFVGEIDGWGLLQLEFVGYCGPRGYVFLIFMISQHMLVISRLHHQNTINCAIWVILRRISLWFVSLSSILILLPTFRRGWVWSSFSSNFFFRP